MLPNKLVQLLCFNKRLNWPDSRALLKIIQCARQNIIAEY
jgi:hypothetical protein